MDEIKAIEDIREEELLKITQQRQEDRLQKYLKERQGKDLAL